MDKFWIETLLKIDLKGNRLDSRVGWSSEIIGFSETLQNVKENFLFNSTRKLDPHYACAEYLWYLMMTDDTTFLQIFAPGYKRFTEDGIHAFGAYGQRWKDNTGGCDSCREHTVDQLTNVIKTLSCHPESRQAIMTMWTGSDLQHAVLVDKKDLPCTLSLQFLLRDGYLNLVTTMRSNDVWLGLPYDVFCFTQLQKLVANQLNVSVGAYTHQAGSMHLYDKNKDQVDEILNKEPIDLYYDGSVSTPWPEDKFRGSLCDWELEKQVSYSKDFVEMSTVGTGEAFISKIKSFDTTIGDAAFVCASKWVPELKDCIFSPQLRRAVEVFSGEE